MYQKYRCDLLYTIFFVFMVLYGHAVHSAEYKVAAPDTPEARPVVALIEAVYAEAGHKAIVHYLPYKRSVEMVNAGQLDSELARINGIDSIYTNLVRVPEPIYTVSVSAVVRQNSNIEKFQWDNLETLRFAYVFGTRLIEVRTEQYDGNAVYSNSSIVEMLKYKRVDVGFMITQEAVLIAKATNDIKIISPPIETTVLYHYLHVKNRELIAVLTDVIKNFYESGRAQKILKANALE